MSPSFWKNKIVSVIQWIVFIFGSILLSISLLPPYPYARLDGFVLVGLGMLILIFKKLTMTTKEERNWFEIIRTLLLVIYVCTLPFTVMFALLWPFTVDSIPNDNLLHLFAFFGFLIPISIVLTLIKCGFEKKKSLIWLMLPLIMATLYLGDSIITGLIMQKKIQAQYAPLSTRGLPPPATDVPVVLPPDPGEAGKATLAGIDSDQDGVRDDLEREIVYMYPQNQEIRRLLTAEIKKEQDIITTTGNIDWYRSLYYSAGNFDACYGYVASSKLGENDNTNDIILLDMLINTPERIKIFDARTSYSQLGPIGKAACDLVKGQY